MMKEFAGRKLFIATRHKKELVMAPMLEKALGVKCLVPENLDTDCLGTFSGETERQDDPVTTARKKCELAMAMQDCDLAIANEGSFGMHSSLFFCMADEELVLLLDKKNDLEISYVFTSTKTNFNGELINNVERLMDFAKHVKFPSHGLIIKRSKEDLKTVVKGITKLDHLLTEFNILSRKYGSVYVQTDMRANYNPMRMEVIEKATSGLIGKIKSRCPVCGKPGFGITAARKGLPCKLCGLPTSSTLSNMYTCKKCGYNHEQLFPGHVQHEDPRYCDYCNP